MFDFEGFVEDCKAAVRAGDGKNAIRDLVERAVSSPSDLLAAIGEPQSAGVNRIHVADDLTILNLVWGPGMTLYPHDHRMWAVIGLYGGREENTFWRRDGETLSRQGDRVVDPGDVCMLGQDAIHSVHNPLQRLTGALHVYGGDFFETPRSEWDPDELTEQAYSVPRAMKMFEDSNERWQAMQRGEI